MDHQSLLYFSSSKKLNWQVCWSLFLSDFSFQIIFCPGKEGGKSDALSWRQDYQLQNSDDQVQGQNQVLLSKEQFLIGVTEERDQLPLLDQIKLAQATDEEIEKLKNRPEFLN